MWRGQLNEPDIEPILEEIEAGEPQPLIQVLLCQMETTRSKGWHTGAPLGICRQTIQNSPDGPPSEQSKGLAG